MSTRSGSTVVLERDADIYTSDGKHLGKVDETRLDYFKVSAPMRPDYWLKTECVATAYADRVTLQFAAAELDAHRGEDPGSPPSIPATSQQQGYIPGASPEDANVHFDPNVAPDERPKT